MRLTYNQLHVHGDNIVECERALLMIVDALPFETIAIEFQGDSITCPSYLIYCDGRHTLAVTFYPGFGRWDHDILASLQERGGVLREAADVIVTGVEDGYEHPIFAVEFCGALPAGNQAWQRSGRAYSFGAVKIPYFYISELGGYELDGQRRRKAARMPNPAVPFSYLSFSLERDTPVFPIFVTSPGADETSRATFLSEFADTEVSEMIFALLHGKDIKEISKKLQRKVLSFVMKRGDAGRGSETLSGAQWEQAFNSIDQGGNITSFLLNHVKQSWSKTAYIDALTDNAKNLMALGSELGVGLTSTKLPMCLLDREKRQEFLRHVQAIYPNLSHEFIGWMSRSQPLAICWVMGFKPRGDDARPDRGLPPLTRMLIGSDHDMLTVVYGPAPVSTWAALESNPRDLANRNGLWEAILETTDALLIESATDSVTRKGFVGEHWHRNLPTSTPSAFFVTPRPTRFSENDVDTAIHLLLSRVMNDEFFEGMCNPPGGDWSGVSLLTPDHHLDLRWVSLTRVSGADTKRPDHVFQIISATKADIILSIESKETPQTLEQGIGPRLTRYIENLVRSPASIERQLTAKGWAHSDREFNLSEYRFASAGAFLATERAKIIDAVNRSETDLVFSVGFSHSGERCKMEIFVCSEIGNEIAGMIERNSSASSNYEFVVTSVV